MGTLRQKNGLSDSKNEEEWTDSVTHVPAHASYSRESQWGFVIRFDSSAFLMKFRENKGHSENVREPQSAEERLCEED